MWNVAYVGVVVAGFGAIAGVLGYLALRLGRGR
ncbi:MAG: small membrane protein MtfM [Micromonosporaceae bacterium]